VREQQLQGLHYPHAKAPAIAQLLNAIQDALSGILHLDGMDLPQDQ